MGYCTTYTLYITVKSSGEIDHIIRFMGLEFLSYKNTVWKFVDFTWNQSWLIQSLKICHIYTFKRLRILLFGNFGTFCSLKLTKLTKFRASKMAITSVLELLDRFWRIDFTKNLSEIKIRKFPHCEELLHFGMVHPECAAVYKDSSLKRVSLVFTTCWVLETQM